MSKRKTKKQRQEKRLKRQLKRATTKPSMEAALERFKAATTPSGAIIEDRTGEPKMSEILLDFAAPLLDMADTNDKDEVRMILSMAATAWNAAIMEDTAGKQALDRLLAPLLKEDPEGKPGLQPYVRMLMDRKREEFGDVQRVITSYEVTMTDTGPACMVASCPLGVPDTDTPDR